jgi:hypothetical protein
MGSGWTRQGPWWLSVIVVGGLNVVRQILFPPSRVGTVVTVVLFFVVLIVGFGVVAAVRRIFPRRLRS